jgi:alkylation response protein AidB-like acyl-CoA dehydrogenase
VPVENVLGRVGEGHKVAFNILNLGRVKLGTRNIAGARLALGNALTYARTRRQFGRAICEFGLIKQKLAEMAIRCFVGDAMVYRSLGEVDRALAAIPVDDRARVLKTIETFSVECSINKVWTSETLGYAVDEAIQVYGGNGYSREFPVERAYRDARITRIYEGTNEINRLLIPTRLLKQSPELFTRDRTRQILSERDGAEASGPFAAERALVGAAKRLVVGAIGSIVAAYGDEVKEQQELLGHAADVASDVYATEGAIARAEKLAARADQANARLGADIARVYASDATDRIVHAAKQIVAALAPHDGAPSALTDLVGRLAARPSIDTVSARRRVADAIIQAGRYAF